MLITHQDKVVFALPCDKSHCVSSDDESHNHFEVTLELSDRAGETAIFGFLEPFCYLHGSIVSSWFADVVRIRYICLASSLYI